MIDPLIAQQPMSHGLQSAASHSTLSDAHVGNSHATAGSARVSNTPSGHDTSQTNGPRSQAEGDGNGNGRRIASLPPGDPLAQLLSEGLALKQMAEQARKRTAVPIRPAPANACLKPNLHSAFVAALLLSDRVMPHVDIRRFSTPPAPGKQPPGNGERASPDTEDTRLAARPASTDESDTLGSYSTASGRTMASPDHRAARLPRMSEKHGGPDQHSADASAAPPMASRGRSNNTLVDAAMASISEAYFTEFPFKDHDRKAIESIFDYVADNKWKGANHEPKDANGARVQMNIEILDHADWELYRIGRKPSDNSRIDLLTTLRIFSYSRLRRTLSEAGTHKKIENLFSTKKLVCFEFVFEKLVHMLSGGDPDQISKNINAHIDRIGKSAAQLKLSLSEDIDLRISKNEISRMVRLLMDPKYLSAELDSPERLRAWIADRGDAWILQLENMTIQFWSGISNLALQRQLSEFNAQVERYAHAQGMGNLARRKSGAVTAKPVDYSSAALNDPNNNDGRVDSLGDPHSARLQLLGQLTLNQTSKLYQPILNLPAYIDDKIRAGISHYAETSGKYQKFTPSTSVKLELVPEERSAHSLLFMRPREKIVRYYSIKQIVTRNYLHDVERLRDPYGRTYRVLKRHAGDLLTHLESIDIRSEALQDITRYRNDPETNSGFRSMLAGLVMTRCLQYLDTANDLPTVYAIESFLRGEIQAETLSFHNVPVSGVFMIRTDARSAILFCAYDNSFFLADSGHNDSRQWPDDTKNGAITRFDQSQEFKDWILSKLPMHALMEYRDDPDAFSQMVGPRANFHPIRAYPSASSEELITTLHTIEMDRYVSDIQTLLDRKTTLIEKLEQAGKNVFNFMTIPLSVIRPKPSLGSLAASVFNFATTADLKSFGLGVSSITSLMSERPDRAEAYYNDALISGILGLVLGGGEGVLSQLLAISHRISVRNVDDAGILRRRPLNVVNIGQALKLFREIRNEIPYLSQNIGLRLPLFRAKPTQTLNVALVKGPAQEQSASNLDKVVGEKSAAALEGATRMSRDFAKKYMRAVHGSFSVLSSRKINVAGKFRVTDELMRNHIDGGIWSIFRIDMDKYYIYTLRPKDTLIHLDNKRLTFSAHGSYIEQESIALDKLVPIPAGKVVSYLTPAGMALGDPGLSETMIFNEIFPYVTATSQSATVSAEAIKKFNTPFDMLGHDMQEQTIRFRDQYFSNFPYENEAEINRALVKNLIHNKGTEKVSDLAVVKPGQLLTLSDLLKKETRHSDLVISACRIFALNGTATLDALQPELKEKLFFALSRNYEAAASKPVKAVQRVVGTPQLDRKTFDEILKVHDGIADKLRCEPRKPCLAVSERRYTAYELLRTYVVDQNKKPST